MLYNKLMNNKNINVHLIAEIGCNHMGNFGFALKMIDVLSLISKTAKIDIIKFQKRCPRLILSNAEYNAPHPDSKNSFGKTYGLHKEFLEFPIEKHQELKKYCEKEGFIYSCSVFDMKSAKEVLALNPKIIKISSANNNDYNLLKYIDTNFDGDIHISLGMTTEKEEENIVKQIKRNKNNLVLYACTSSYPTKDENINLLEISKLKHKYSKDIKAIGFSGHHNGIIHDIAAIALGATYVERHFTLDKTLKGTDQSFSLSPDEFLELAKYIKRITQSLTYKDKEILDVERDIRERLKYRG